MKKTVLVVTAFLLICTIVLPLTSCDSQGTKGLEFELLPDGTYGVRMGTTQNLEKITIPESHNGKKVTQILYGAFENATNLKSITIPDSVTSLGNNVFEDCSSLTSIKYHGTEAQWKTLDKVEGWDDYYAVKNYTITYEYTGE